MFSLTFDDKTLDRFDKKSASEHEGIKWSIMPNPSDLEVPNLEPHKTFTAKVSVNFV